MSECTEDGDSTSEWWSSTYKTTKCHNPEHHHQVCIDLYRKNFSITFFSFLTNVNMERINWTKHCSVLVSFPVLHREGPCSNTGQ